MAMKVKIFERNSNISTGKFFRIKRRIADELVERGLAVKVGKFQYQRTDNEKISAGPASRQGRVYERAAIETVIRPHSTGGLTRTEKQPRNIPAFTGARVGHQ